MLEWDMAVFENPDDLKEAILDCSSNDFFENYVSGRETSHFDGEKLDFVSEVIYEEYGISISRAEMIVVGSSKLGFALHDKFREGKLIASAFRRFNEDSDIDLSICSPKLFVILWHELSEYLCNQRSMPYRHKKLGDYLTYGWLRQDQFPNATASKLVKCDNLRFARGKIRRDRKRGHPKIDFGIFYDTEHLKLYQARSIDACRQVLESPL